jgi:hypothetical protein
MPSGYAPEQIGFWWVAVGMILVVTLVASILLQLLITLVKDINNWVGQIIETLGATAQNTEQAYRIGEVAQAVDAILNEGLQHHLVLTRGLVAAESEGRMAEAQRGLAEAGRRPR